MSQVTTKIHHYFSLLLFTAAVMMGVQLPNFVDQYQKRVDAHFKEVQLSFGEYQRIANRLHGGSIEALIQQHETSPDPTFRSEAEPIRLIHVRKLRFEAEMNAMSGSFWSQAAHVLFNSDREILTESYNQYSVSLPLNTNAIICGLSFGAIAGFFLEMLVALFRYLLKPRRKPPEPQSSQ